MFGETELYAALNVSGITDLLGSYGTGSALFNANVIPADCEVAATINYYMSIPWTDTEYQLYIYSINCREKTFDESVIIAKAVIDNINRVLYSDYYIVCSVTGTIEPRDETDNFNTLIEAKIKKK